MSARRLIPPIVSFRGGDLTDALTDRTTGKDALGRAAKRDLGRYYALLDEALPQLRLTPGEARLLVRAVDPLLDERMEASPHRWLWATVDDAVTNHPGAAVDVADPAAFVARLRRLRPVETRAIVDAIERYRIALGKGWDGGEDTLLRHVGLTV